MTKSRKGSLKKKVFAKAAESLVRSYITPAAESRPLVPRSFARTSIQTYIRASRTQSAAGVQSSIGPCRRVGESINERPPPPASDIRPTRAHTLIGHEAERALNDDRRARGKER